jgi:DHA2 family multidrug resistance protein
LLLLQLIANKSELYRSNLVAHLDVNDFDVQQRVAALKASFIAKGYTPDKALNANQMLDFSVTKQATVLSYMDVFLYLGLMFLICIPFVLFVRERKGKGEKIDLSSVH